MRQLPISKIESAVANLNSALDALHAGVQVVIVEDMLDYTTFSGMTSEIKISALAVQPLHHPRISDAG